MGVFDAPPPQHWDHGPKTVVVAEHDFTNPALRGISITDPKTGICYVTLKKYPECLAHEMRHCLEGDWHPWSDADVSWCDSEKY